MARRTIADTARALREGATTSTALVEESLGRARSDRLNAFLNLDEDGALESAAAADKAIADGAGGPLTGIPMAHKDIFCTSGVLTTCGSRMLEDFVPPYDACVVERLRAAGAVMIGKTNMDEFAMGSSNETSAFGPVTNPWDEQRSPGGSSGGSAAAVADGIVQFATGTDTGGSIRQPAALTGITGFKPTYGRVSRYGMIAFASSLDQAGTLTLTAEDAALVMQAMAGFDERDSTCAEVDVPDYGGALDVDLSGRRIGVPAQFFDEGLSPGCAAAVREAFGVFEQLGAEIVDIELPHLPLSVSTYYIVAPAECSSNLSRFDGIRFGHRADDTADLESLYKKSRSEGFGDEVKRRIMTGTYVLSAGYYDAYYLKAQKVRQLIGDDFRGAFESVDVVAGPTTPTPAFSLGEKVDDPVQMYLNDIYTIGANLAGLPGISVPCGVVDGLPAGLQIVGPHFGEGTVLGFAHRYQSETDWHRLEPGQ